MKKIILEAYSFYHYMISDITFNLTQNGHAFALVGNYVACNIMFNGNFGGGKIVAEVGDYDTVIPFTADVTPSKISNCSIDLTKIPNGARGYFRFAPNTPAYNKFRYPFLKTETDVTNPATDFIPKEQFSFNTLKQINFTQANADLEFVSLDCISELQIKDLLPSYKNINEPPVEITTPQYLTVEQNFDKVTYYKVEGAISPNIEIKIYNINEYHCLKIL